MGADTYYFKMFLFFYLYVCATHGEIPALMKLVTSRGVTINIAAHVAALGPRGKG